VSQAHMLANITAPSSCDWTPRPCACGLGGRAEQASGDGDGSD